MFSLSLSSVTNFKLLLLQVVIKYVPYVGDSKRAMDEYTSEIFMDGRNTIVMYNMCEKTFWLPISSLISSFQQNCAKESR